MEYFEYAQEREFEGKAYRLSYRMGRRKKIRRAKINESYIYREALHCLWREHEKEVRDFEKRRKYR